MAWNDLLFPLSNNTNNVLSVYYLIQASMVDSNGFQLTRLIWFTFIKLSYFSAHFLHFLLPYPTPWLWLSFSIGYSSNWSYFHLLFSLILYNILLFTFHLKYFLKHAQTKKNIFNFFCLLLCKSKQFKLSFLSFFLLWNELKF